MKNGVASAEVYRLATTLKFRGHAFLRETGCNEFPDLWTGVRTFTTFATDCADWHGLIFLFFRENSWLRRIGRTFVWASDFFLRAGGFGCMLIGDNPL